MLRRVKKELTMTACSEENNARRYRRKTFLVLVVVLVVVLAILELFGEEIKVEDDDMVLAHNHRQKSKVTSSSITVRVWQPYFIYLAVARNLSSSRGWCQRLKIRQKFNKFLFCSIL